MGERQERAWVAGTRVRVVAPGWRINGLMGRVDFDARAGGLLTVRLDNGKRAALATFEAARLRDQGTR